MRTEVKIAVVIATCLVLLFVAWYFVFYQRPGQPAAGELTRGQGHEGEEVNRVPAGEPAGETSADTTAGAAAGTEAPAEPDESARAELITPGYQERLAPADETAEADVTASEPPSAAGEEALPAPAQARLPDVTGLTPAAPAATAEETTPAAGAQRTYVVKKGDTYWRIAQREYGDGALCRLIQDANPNVQPTRLRPGTTIVLPPRPTRAAGVAVGAGEATAAAGTLATDPATGKRYYVIKSGDQGFWTVAKVAYGSSAYFALIAAANPDLDPRRLKPGDRVWVPEKPAGAPGGTGGSGRPAAEVGVSARPEAPVVSGVRVITGAPATARLPDGTLFD